jgi:hypothetical protein
LTKTGEYGFVNAEIDICFSAYERIFSFGGDSERLPGLQLKEGGII